MPFQISATSREEAIFWDNIASLGWCSFLSFFMLFTLVLTEKDKMLKKQILYPLIFSPALFYILLQWKDYLMSDYIRTPLGWASVWADNIWVTLFFMDYIFLVISLYIMFHFGRKTKKFYKRKQIKIIFNVTIISTVLGTITDWVFPATGHPIPSMSLLFILIWVSGIVYAITKYQLMTLTAVIATDEIVLIIPDALFIVVPDLSIINVNKAACELTGYTKEEFIGKSIETILPKWTKQMFKNKIFAELPEEDSFRDYNTICRTKNGQDIPVSFSASLIRDKGKNIIGMINIIRDMRELLKLQRKEKELTEEKTRINALEEMKIELERKVIEQTSELQDSYQELSKKKQILDSIQKFTVRKELEMIKLKEEANSLLEKPGLSRKYTIPDKTKRIKESSDPIEVQKQ